MLVTEHTKTNFMSGDPDDNVALHMEKFSLALAKAKEPSLCSYILNPFKYINCVEYTFVLYHLKVTAF